MRSTRTQRTRNTWTRRATTWTLLGAFLGTLPGAPAAIAAPEGERVVKGKAKFERDGKHTRITTKSRETIVDYDRFGIAEDESVRIDQPSKRSRILNRVGSGDESRIDGALSSNGTVYILNPAGVFIGDRAVLDVGGLVAGAGALSNKDFMNGVDRFTDVTGDVGVAAGADVRATRNVVLVGRNVENLGSISTERGMVALVAGENVLLTRHGGHVIVRVDGPGEQPSGTDFALTQAGEIQSQHVTLAAGDAYSLAMNHTGITRAQEIHVQAEGDGLVQVAGTLDASNAAPGGQGGNIRVQGSRIAVQDAELDASGATGGGAVLVGGDVRGTGDMPTARRVYVGEDAELRADATGSGDGGTVVVYADEQTSFYGTLSARGGPQGGDGGFAEISGRSLAAQGDIDLGASNGKTGTLLYDPDKIVIIGGSADGSDDPDSSPQEIEQSRLGQVLSGDTGELVGDAFQIYESEIESTNANIVLEATNRIETQGFFNHDSSTHPESDETGYEGDGFVVILPGNSLTLRTTGTTAPSGVTSDNDQDLIGIDLTAGGNDNLAWRVSKGGSIALDTNLSTSQNPTPTTPKASIEVGKLESTSARFETDDRFDVDLPVLDGRSIEITATRGDIIVGGIDARGENAVPPVDDGNPDTVDRGRSASGGAEMTLTSQQGNIAIAGPIFGQGGSGTGEGPGNQGSQGFDGAEITISTQAGNVAVDGEIDVSGGNGLGAIFARNQADPNNPIPLTGGGNGGTITLAANGGADEGKLEVLRALTARGGSGFPHLDNNGVVQATAGGVGGAMALSATQTISIGTPGAAPIKLDASGGDGSGSGGAARNDFSLEGVPGPNLSRSFRITGRVDGATQASTNGLVAIHAELVARGGNGRQFADGGDFPESKIFGGLGGSGGGFFVIPHSLDASEMRLDLSGGSGSFASAGPIDPPRAPDGSVIPLGGNGGDVSIFSTEWVDIGGTASDLDGDGNPAPHGIISRGGDATNGDGGVGGTVTVSAGDGAEASDEDEEDILVVGDIDVSGGDARPSNTATEVTLLGGLGGSVELASNEKTVGSLLLRGRIGGDGGTGVDGKTETSLHADGAELSLAAVRAIQVDESALNGDGSVPADVVLSGGNVTLSAGRIGGRGDDVEAAPIPIAGTHRTKAEGGDTTTVTADGTIADGTIAIEIRSENGLVDPTLPAEPGPDALEQLNVVMRKETGAALVRRGSDEVLRSVKAEAGSPHTVQRMQTANDDPSLSYRLDVDVAANTDQPDLAIDRGAVAVGTSGGEIINGGPPNPDTPTALASNRGAIVGTGDGTAPHVASAGTVRLEGTTLGSNATPLEFAASGPDAILRLDARGEIDGEVLSGSFHGIEIVQHDAARNADIAMPGNDGIQIAGVGTEPAPISRIVRVVTTDSDSGFSYRLSALPEDDSVADAVLEVDQLDLGGDGLLITHGDVVLRDDAAPTVPTPIRTNGHALTLASTSGDIRQESTSAVSIDMTGGPADGRQLVLLADDDIGATNAKIRTRGVSKLAGQTSVGNFLLVNRDDGTGGEDAGLYIQKLSPKDPALLETPANAETYLGIRAGGINEPGSIDIENVKDAPDDPDAPAVRIVLSELTDGVEFAQPHLIAFDDIRLKADAIEIENARFFETQQPTVGKVYLPFNDARIVAGGDVALEGPVRTSLGSIASVEEPEAGAPTPTFVHASLGIQANGTTTFGGNVGGELTGAGSDAGYRLALLDTTAASTGDAAARSFRVGQARFRGTLDGPAAVQIDARDLGSADEAHVASATFDGNLGTQQRLGGLVVDAEQIEFTSADQIVASGAVSLDTNQTSTPPAATIFDTRGGLHIQTDSAFTTGEHDKLSVQGPLSIRADSVTVGDVNAARELSVDSENITIRARAGAPIMGRDGEIIVDEEGDPIDDGGTDWVADRIRLSSTPEIEDSELGPVRLGVGGGGISAPAGVFQAAEVVYFTPGVRQVTASDMQATTGQILDLQATGRAVVGNPAEDLPRERPLTDPSLPPRYSEEGPALAPGVDAEQLLAFLRCGDAAGPSADCDAADAERLGSVRDWPDSALATPRAEQIAASYREMRSRDLSTVFDAAGAGFREAQGFGEFDPSAFARYLEQSPDHPEARAAIHRLAGVLVEIDLLGLPADDETRVRREIAGALAAEADLPGFDTDAVLEAVEATPIELPQ